MEMKAIMQMEKGRFIVILFICIGLMFIGACTKKRIGTGYTSAAGAGNQAGTGLNNNTNNTIGQQGSESNLSESGLNGNNTGGQGTQAGQLTEAAQTAREQFESNDIFFEYNSAALLPEAQAILMEKAEWLQNNPQAAIVVEGHTDERGTVAYNLALGDRRAESVRAFLMELGVNVDRIRTVSYGEERPLDNGHTEAAWARNRRAHFVVE
ncbi:MAG: peptidoglycan-associated lipoprotein Pal [Deltaproteobacteria bacterium]|nr:MAG: peptidoglycan-associated lipoprotein Pal [Deltaproteobacteria bacterium]